MIVDTFLMCDESFLNIKKKCVVMEMAGCWWK